MAMGEIQRQIGPVHVETAQRPERFNVVEAAKRNIWTVTTDSTGRKHLVVKTRNFANPACDAILAAHNGINLPQPPTPLELKTFASITVLEGGTPTPEEHVQREEFWAAQGGMESMGALFPDLAAGLENFGRLKGRLDPSKIAVTPETTIENPDEFNQYLDAVAERRIWTITNVLDPKQQAGKLDQLLTPETENRHLRVAIVGLGDIGKHLAMTLRAKNKSDIGVDTVYIHTRTPQNLRRIQSELDDINFEGESHPAISSVTTEQLNNGYLFDKDEQGRDRVDVVIFLAAGPIIKAEETGNKDPRGEQFLANRRVLYELMQTAEQTQWKGNIIIASDPIEPLAESLRVLSHTDSTLPISPSQVAGGGIEVQRSRGRGVLQERGIGHDYHHVRAWGEHSVLSVVTAGIEDTEEGMRTMEQVSIEAARRHLRTRHHGGKPYLAAILAIEHLLKNIGTDQPHYVSMRLPSNDPYEPATYFGTRAVWDRRARAWVPSVELQLPEQVHTMLGRLHSISSRRSHRPQNLLVNPFESNDHLLPDETRHPAFDETAYHDLLTNYQ